MFAPLRAPVAHDINGSRGPIERSRRRTQSATHVQVELQIGMRDMKHEIQVLKQLFDAINRNDMEAMIHDFDPQIVRIEPEGHSTSGTYRGIAAVQAQVAQGRGTWAEGTCDPEEFLTKAHKVVVYLHARVRLKATNEWVGGRFADGFTFRDGKIIEYQTFWERADALEWAGIEDPV